MFLIVVSPFVGSFLGLLADRLPRGDGVVWGRSRCEACGAALGALDLLPLLSWLLLRGRCRHCGARVGLFYPLIELGALAVAVWAALVMPDGLAWLGAGLGWTLLALAVIDTREFLLPDILTLPLIAAGLLAAWLMDLGQPLDHAIGAVAGFLILAAIAWLYRRLRGRDGLGLGDAKLFAAAGAWVSWAGLLSVLLWASILALVVALVTGLRRGTLSPSMAVPFGPYLALGLWLTWLYGPLQFG